MQPIRELLQPYRAWGLSQPEHSAATVSTMQRLLFVDALYQPDYLCLRVRRPFACLSNAVWNGGLRNATHWVNWKVPLDYDCVEPERAMKVQLAEWGLPPDQTVGLQTAAKLSHATFATVQMEAFQLVSMVTVGTGNAVRAGRNRQTYEELSPGTVNCMVLIEGKMTESALANAFITITEAKTAALQDAGIRDASCELPATGTTTDAIIVGVSQSDECAITHRYAGTATLLGHEIEKMIYHTVLHATRTQSEP